MPIFLSRSALERFDDGQLRPIAARDRRYRHNIPRETRDHLQLHRPIYERTAAYGHFGREAEADGGFSWEKLDLVDDLKTLLG